MRHQISGLPIFSKQRNNPHMPISWDDACLAALSDKDLLQLRDNASRKNSADILALCEADITRRNLGIKPKRTRSAVTESDPLRILQSDMSAAIGEFAVALARKYDLSAETAKKQSDGFPRFIPHKLVQANGTAKLGGLQRTGLCRLDRYTSYRVKDTVLSLNMFLGKDAADSAVEYQVFGPKDLLPDGVSIEKLRPGLDTEKESKLFKWGQRFSRLSEAKAAFEELIAKVAVPL
jgi:hypothetical protein